MPTFSRDRSLLDEIRQLSKDSLVVRSYINQRRSPTPTRKIDFVIQTHFCVSEIALISKGLSCATRFLSLAMMGLGDEFISPQLVLFQPAKYRIQRGAAEYEVVFNLNGRTKSETKLTMPRKCGSGFEEGILLTEVLLWWGGRLTLKDYDLCVRRDHVMYKKW